MAENMDQKYQRLLATIENHREYWQGYSDAENRLLEGKDLQTAVRKAAPALLEAAKRAYAALEALPPRWDEDRYEPMNMLRAAIALAVGKEAAP